MSNRFLSGCQEYIFHFSKKGENRLKKLEIGIPYQDKSNIGRWKAAKEDKGDRGDTWFIPYETIRSKTERPHPAILPVKLPEMCIKLHGIREDMLIADPFSGIGSTAIASLRVGFHLWGLVLIKDISTNQYTDLLRQGRQGYHRF